MKFGLWSNGSRTTAVRNKIARDTYEADAYEIIVADELGFDEAWFSEHTGLHREDTLPAAEMFIAQLAARTKQIMLGTAVRSVPLYHPIDIAMQAAACDHLTNGRYMLGVGSGAGSNGMEQRGLDRRQSQAMMRESLQLVFRCWAETERFDYDGEFYHGKGIRVLPKPLTKPHMTMAVASRDEDTMKLAAEHDMRFLLSYHADPAGLRRSMDAFDQAHATAGKEPRRKDVAVARSIYVAETEQQARNDMRQSMNVWFDEVKGFVPNSLLPYAPNGDVSKVDFDYSVDVGAILFGTPDQVYDGIKRIYDETGGFGQVMLVCGKDWGTAEQRAHSFELFMQKVAPRLKDLDPDVPALAESGAAR